MNETTPKKKSFYSYLKENLGLITTLTYLIACIISLLYNVQYYNIYNIKYINYIEVSDIILSIRNINYISLIVIILTVLTVLWIGELLYSIGSEIRINNLAIKSLKNSHTKNDMEEGIKNVLTRKSKNDLLKYIFHFSRKLFYLLISLLFILFTIELSITYNLSKSLNNDLLNLTSVEFKVDKLNKLDGLQLIGNTSKYCFFYESKSKQSIIVPSSEILFMRNNITAIELTILQDFNILKSKLDSLDLIYNNSK